MQDYILTYTGIRFYPAHPDPDTIKIEDIAHALSLICRGNGQVSMFFSVGQHCINCAKEAEKRGLDRRIQLACLLHDAGECYLSDVPRPFKKEIPYYIERENELIRMIYLKFLGMDLSEDESRMVKEIDDAMLAYDLQILLGQKTDPMPEVHIELSYEVRAFSSVESEYMALFQELYEQ